MMYLIGQIDKDKIGVRYQEDKDQQMGRDKSIPIERVD